MIPVYSLLGKISPPLKGETGWETHTPKIHLILVTN